MMEKMFMEKLGKYFLIPYFFMKYSLNPEFMKISLSKSNIN